MSTIKRKANYGLAKAKFWVATLAAGLAATSATAPRLAPPEFAGLYRPAIERLLPVTRREGDSLRILLNQKAPTPGSAATTALRLTAWANYGAKEPLWQQVRVARPYPGSDPAAPTQVITVAVAAAQLPAGAVLQVSREGSATSIQTNADQDPSTTTWLPITAERLSRSFVLLDSTGLLLDRPYAYANEGLAVVPYGLNQPVRWRRYPTGKVALPPFTDPRSQSTAPRTLGVLDSSAAPVQAGGLLHLAKPGLYALKVGGTGGEPVHTLPLLVLTGSFPGQSTPMEVIEPLLYLTTNAERQQMLKSPDPKKAIDEFWLQAAGGDQARARTYIRRYYTNVTTANELFTGHKAGWLTDRGLLYVVLGRPQGVRRFADGSERWHYDEAGPHGAAESFTFRPRPTTLAPDNYELVRRPEYELPWYAAVEQWRRTMSAR